MMKDHIKLHAATNSFATRARADQTNPNDTQRDILKTGPKSSFLQQVNPAPNYILLIN